MRILERFADDEASVILGWLEPDVLYSRFEGVISADLGARVARRLAILLGELGGVQYFSDLSGITSFDAKAFSTVTAAMRAKHDSFLLIVTYTGQMPLSVQALELPNAFASFEYAPTADAFAARLRAATPTAETHAFTTLINASMDSGDAAWRHTIGGEPSRLFAAKQPIADSPYTYAFDLREFEGGKFTAVRWPSVPADQTASWFCVAKTDQQALALARQASIAEWNHPKTRAPEQFTVEFYHSRSFGGSSAASAATSGRTATDISVPTSPPAFERLSEQQGSITLGWVASGVLYAHFAGVISTDLGQRFAERFTFLVGYTGAVRFFSDSSQATAYDMKAYSFMVDALLTKSRQLEVFVNFPWPKLGDRARALPQAIPCLEYVFSAEEFEARLRAAAPTAHIPRPMPLKELDVSERADHENAARVAASLPARSESGAPTYTYVFDLHDFENGSFIATRFSHLLVRPRGAWTCVAHSDEHALTLARRAALAEWAQPSSRRPEDFTVQFRHPRDRQPFNRSR